jgi:membrane protein DedA with SNARE-associated domain
MKTETKLALSAMLMTLTADAMAQSGGPRQVMWMLSGGVVGGLIGFWLGLWWCRHCHDKQKGDKPGHPNDR